MRMEDEEIVSCINLHHEHFIEEAIVEYYVTEENMTTVRGKYWNRLWTNEEPMTDEDIAKISQYYYLHCLMSH